MKLCAAKFNREWPSSLSSLHSFIKMASPTAPSLASAGSPDTLACRQHFPRIQRATGIEQILELFDQIQRFIGELARQLHFFHPHAVLAGKRAANRNAKLENFFTRLLCPLQFSGFTRIERQDGVHVTVARIEHVTDRDTIPLPDFFDRPQGARLRRAIH